MQHRKSFVSNFSRSRFFTVFSALMTGFLVLMGCLFLFSLIVSKIDMPDAAITVMSTVSLCAGAYAGGFCCAKKRRKNGLVSGVLTGFSMFVVIFLISLIFARTAVSISAFSKLMWAVVFGAVGGVLGVNSKRRGFR